MRHYLKKVKEFQEASLSPVLNNPTIIDKERFSLRVSLIKEELQELEDSYNNKNLKEMLDALCDLQYVLSGMVLETGFKDKFDDFFDKVHKSNMSKFCKTYDEAQESVNAYATGTHPNKLGEIIETYIVSTNSVEYPFVVKRKDGKILKSINHLPC